MKHTIASSFWASIVLCLGVGCGGSDPPAIPMDSASVDTTPVDTRPVDTGPMDTGPMDTGPMDTGPMDTGQRDTTPQDTPPVDSGPRDTGVVDTGPVDTGPVDTGPADLAPTDSTPVDAGPTDTVIAEVAPTDMGSVDSTPMDVPPVDSGPLCLGTQSLCAGVCVTLQSDPSNCGSCANLCSSGRMCVNGTCRVVCPSGQSECAGSCFNLQSDGVHCGSCDMRCSPGLSCVMGACALVCPTGQSVCSGVCTDTRSDRRNCGTCGMPCDTGQVCATGVCRAARACDDLLRQSPGTPSGSYIIDPDGPEGRDAFRVYCDMTTDGGGWTLVAAAAGETNMPRFDSPTIAPCTAASPSAPCYMGSANFVALALTEFRWSIEPLAVSSRAPIENHRAGGAPDTNAICVSSTEYFRVNQDSAAQGMGWNGCEPSEVYHSTAVCNSMFRPVWNLLVCEGIPIAPDPRSSPDSNCSPFGRYGNECTEFRNIRHWRRGQSCPTEQTNCGGHCRAVQYDVNNCGTCGATCGVGLACVDGVCSAVASCADLLRREPAIPSGRYPIDPDGVGGAAGFPVYCDMVTGGGGWTLVAAAVTETNMPRFSNNAVRPCIASTPNAPCFMGRAALGALSSRDFAWSTGTTALNTREPIDMHREGAADTNAICVSNTEYFRVNQDQATQGMGWTGCEPSEVYDSTEVCNSMFRPVWNLLVCEGIPIAPGQRSSPDFNCSPFGRVGRACAGFYNIRHWRR